MVENLPFENYFVTNQDYFIVYRQNANLLGKIPNENLRRAIISSYTTAKALLDSYALNNHFYQQVLFYYHLKEETANQSHINSWNSWSKALIAYAPKLKDIHNQFKIQKNELFAKLRKHGISGKGPDASIGNVRKGIYEVMNEKETMANRYWNLANYVVGFVAVQTLAFMYLIAQMPGSLKQTFEANSGGIFLISGVVGSTIIYAYLLHGCWKAESSLLAGNREALHWSQRDYRTRWRLVVGIQAATGVLFYVIVHKLAEGATL